MYLMRSRNSVLGLLPNTRKQPSSPTHKLARRRRHHHRNGPTGWHERLHDRRRSPVANHRERPSSTQTPSGSCTTTTTTTTITTSSPTTTTTLHHNPSTTAKRTPGLRTPTRVARAHRVHFRRQIRSRRKIDGILAFNSVPCFHLIPWPFPHFILEILNIGAEKVASIWSPETGTFLRKLIGHTRPPTASLSHLLQMAPQSGCRTLNLSVTGISCRWMRFHFFLSPYRNDSKHPQRPYKVGFLSQLQCPFEPLSLRRL